MIEKKHVIKRLRELADSMESAESNELDVWLFNEKTAHGEAAWNEEEVRYSIPPRLRIELELAFDEFHPR